MTRLTEAMLGSAAACLVFGWVLTIPVELRKSRWRRIIYSVPFAMVIAYLYTVRPLEARDPSGMYMIAVALASIFFLVLLWRGVLLHYLAEVFSGLLYGTHHPLPSRPNFRMAKRLYRRGKHAEALQCVRAELAQEPIQYEGLMLEADIHLAQGNVERALRALELLTIAPLTEAERALVRERTAGLEERLRLEQPGVNA